MQALALAQDGIILNEEEDCQQQHRPKVQNKQANGGLPSKLTVVGMIKRKEVGKRDGTFCHFWSLITSTSIPVL
jgi:hypothetical protein